MFIDTALIEDLIFKRYPRFPTNRFTQDSPVYPDVWLEYYNHRKSLDTFRADLILTPHRNSSAAELFRQLSEILWGTETHQYSELATNGESVVVKLTFHEMLTLALPMTNWWQKYLFKEGKATEDHEWLSYIVNTIDFSAVYDDRNYETQTELEKALEAIARRKDWYKENNSESKPLVLWSINRNRKASVSVYNSVPATKADSCRRLFDVDGAGIVWAVLDSGIDARHMAFRLLNKEGKPLEPGMGKKDDPNSNNTRVVATYDFSKFRSILVKIHDGLEIDVIGSGDNDAGLPKKQVGEYLDDVQHALENGRILDWSVLAPLIRIPHNKAQYTPPKNSHGTHVAGILGANIDEGNGRSMTGMCPGIKLYDLRVFDERGEGEEFNIMAAIQFVRWLNNQKDVQAIHGVNMSISMTHDVASYACGQTPVCVACNRLVAEGTVVVAAAGNLGQTMYKSKEGAEAQGFRMVNITDPGNAEKVITVGATHRDQPHAYGVSYFSSKGPTGDGRLKPDLVAPGEKIISTMVDQGIDRMDGTSMAAPHVSGAAALILSRHRELIGKPEKVKQIICATATDLGREKYFQGCGMLDVLRAVQSI